MSLPVDLGARSALWETLRMWQYARRHHGGHK